MRVCVCVCACVRVCVRVCVCACVQPRHMMAMLVFFGLSVQVLVRALETVTQPALSAIHKTKWDQIEEVRCSLLPPSVVECAGATSVYVCK